MMRQFILIHQKEIYMTKEELKQDNENWLIKE